MEKLIKEPPRDGGPKEDLVYNVNNADLVFNSDNCKLLESQKKPHNSSTLNIKMQLGKQKP